MMSGGDEPKDPTAIQLDTADDAVIEPGPAVSVPPSSLGRKTPPPLPPSSLAAPTQPTAQLAARSQSSRAVYGVIIAVMLIGGGVGGLLFANYLRSKPPAGAADTASPAATAPVAAATTTEAPSAPPSAAPVATGGAKSMTLPEVEIK